jgi:choline dehydrogenase-like flavoprotein
MFTDARSVERESALEAEVCIIGAGAAGITLAREFDGAPFRVVVLESGGFEIDSDTHALYGGRSIGLPYGDLRGSRLRFLGGSTNHWGGICRPFEEADFEPRDGIPFTGWPIRKRHVDPYYNRAAQVLQLPSDRWDMDHWAPPNQPRPIELASERIVSRAAQVVPTELRSLGRTHRDLLDQSRNVSVYLWANVTAIEVAEGARIASSVRVATLSGNRFSVTAKVFILATGAIENARILLASNEQVTAGMGNQHGLVGRFFLEHPRFTAAILAPLEPHPNLSFYDPHVVRGFPMRGYMATSKEFQLAEELLDCQIRFEIGYGEAPASPADFAQRLLTLAADIRSWQRIAMPGLPLPVPYLSVVREGLRSPRDTYIYLSGRIETLAVTTRFEQAPNPDSRLVLEAERDELGMQRVALDWQLNDADRRNVERTLELIGAEVSRAGIGRLQVLYQAGSDWPDDLNGGQHHMGTTRMSDDPKQGVVDADCLVHGMSNLYIAGCSVYPTPGGATPTLTLIALAIRLADHLKDKVLR